MNHKFIQILVTSLSYLFGKSKFVWQILFVIFVKQMMTNPKDASVFCEQGWQGVAGDAGKEIWSQSSVSGEWFIVENRWSCMKTPSKFEYPKDYSIIYMFVFVPLIVFSVVLGFVVSFVLFKVFPTGDISDTVGIHQIKRCCCIVQSQILRFLLLKVVESLPDPIVSERVDHDSYCYTLVTHWYATL